jgi:hypothetical protein
LSIGLSGHRRPQPIRDAVHVILDLVPRYKEERGGQIYVDGDPVWTVVADEALSDVRPAS